jgi:hypothetical protein
MELAFLMSWKIERKDFSPIWEAREGQAGILMLQEIIGRVEVNEMDEAMGFQ